MFNIFQLALLTMSVVITIAALREGMKISFKYPLILLGGFLVIGLPLAFILPIPHLVTFPPLILLTHFIVLPGLKELIKRRAIKAQRDFYAILPPVRKIIQWEKKPFGGAGNQCT